MNQYLGDYLYENCRLTGRGYLDQEEKVLYTNWSGAGLGFRMRGKKIALSLRAMWAPEYEGVPGDTTAPFHKNWPWIAVFVDGEEVLKREIGEERLDLLAWESKQMEEHEISIIKLTENFKTECGFEAISIDGELLASTLPRRERIEFIGDSITCGFGNMTMEANRFFYTEDENALFAHGPLAAKMLDMDYSLVSVSGICATTNKGLPMEYAMDELYEYTDRVIEDLLKHKEYECFDFEKNPNRVVVLNLGTNDGTGMFMSPDEQAELSNFKVKYKEFLRTIRRCNPKAYIISALGTMNYYLLPEIMQCVEEYKSETGDEQIMFYRYRGMHPMDGLGACAHPSKPSQQKMAEEIAAVIKNIL